MSVLSLYQKKIAAQTSSEDRIKEVQGLLPFWALLTGADGSIHCDSVGQNWQPVHAFKPWIARNNVPMCQCALFLPFPAHLEAPPWPTLLHVSWSSNLDVIMLANVHKSLSQCCQEALPMPVANSVCSPLRSQQSSNLTAECIQRRTPDCPWHAFLRISLCTQHKQISMRSWPTTSDSRVISVILSSNANANCHWPAFSQAVIAALKPQAQTCKRVFVWEKDEIEKSVEGVPPMQKVLQKSVCN